MPRSQSLALALTALVLATLASPARAAGTLQPVGSAAAPIEIAEHRVSVRIQNGFSRTEVRQRFYNPNALDLEAVYAFPLPQGATLAEVSLQVGEQTLDGEVVERAVAEQLYTQERDAGRDAGIAVQNGYRTYEFAVARVAAQSHAQMRFVYYQALELDTGVGRYVYPLESGGTDDVAARFWVANERVSGAFSVDVELDSAWPVADVRIPGFEAQAEIRRESEGGWHARLEAQGAELRRDFVLYYRLQDGLPGRVEVVPYRAPGTDTGAFMAIVTPGIDLAPLQRGSDTVFVLDVSGSMEDKLATLVDGVTRVIGELDPRDRFRVVLFNNRAHELTRGWTPATRPAVEDAIAQLAGLRANGGTNLYDGLGAALRDVDADRATSVVIVTDAVTNTGVVDPRRFHEFMRQHDVRVFGFLLGNSGNWPLMRTIAEASGGFYAGVSNAEDILGQILLARSKVTHQALHDAEFTLRGVRTSEVTGRVRGKIFRGQQLVLFGRYHGAGEAVLELRARLTGEDKLYTTRFQFPEQAPDHPEIERLWAIARVAELQGLAASGRADPRESAQTVRELGLAQQIVTDETAMLVLDDASFERLGIERRNRARVAAERQAQSRRAARPTPNLRVDRAQPTYSQPASRLGGGALDPLSALGLLGLGAAALAGARRGEAR